MKKPKKQKSGSSSQRSPKKPDEAGKPLTRQKKKHAGPPTPESIKPPKEGGIVCDWWHEIMGSLV
ncbi:MAG: hypothetical protein CSA62_12520 [Planctomycetota bacterium]|nr:MAG: hypothetical protein CSA62_12520 [Planctomycetota bacterium]